MANTSPSAFYTIFLVVVVVVPSGNANAGGNQIDWISSTFGCQESVADCLLGDEFAMDSEINRRILKMSDRHISYGALDRNRVPCSIPGAPYTNCHPGGPANAYNRGCSAIARCRSGRG